MISTRKDRSIAAFIQGLNQHIQRRENQMCADMMDLKKAKTRIIELEEELKFTRDGYGEEIKTLLEKNDDLVKKIGVSMGGPAPIEEEEEPKEIRPRTTSSSTTPILILVMMTLKMKLEQTSWSLPPIKISR